jgi:hypothetical protein
MDFFGLILNCQFQGAWIWVVLAGVLWGCTALTPLYFAHLWFMAGVIVLFCIPSGILPFTGEGYDCLAKALVEQSGAGATRLIENMHRSAEWDVAVTLGGALIVAVVVFLFLRLLMRKR